MNRDDEDGFAAFVAGRGTSLLRFAYLACGDEREAEDLLQTALERAYKRWNRVQYDNPEPYVRRIIVNASINQARRRAVLRFIPMFAPPELPARNSDLDLRWALMDALRGLPPRQRFWQAASPRRRPMIGENGGGSWWSPENAGAS